MSANSGKQGRTRKYSTALARMKQDYMRLKRDPLPYVTAEPLPNNMLEWHYVVKGPEDSPYFGGYYHGTLLFPREFPFKPPSIYMFTPNGRFKTNTRLCLSISDFHPDTWNPTWSVGTILTGLLSFMLENTATLGSIETTIYEKQQYAKKSLSFNLKNPQFVELFPEICEEIRKRINERKKYREKLRESMNAAINNNGTTVDDFLQNNSMNSLSLNAGQDNIDESLLPESVGFRSLSNFSFNWQSNLVTLICFAIFTFIVNCVLKNITYE